MTTDPERISHTLFYAGAFLLWYSISLMVSALPHFATLQHQLLMPLLCLLEFAALVPLYRWYTRRYQDIPLGSLRPRQLLLFTLLLLLLIASQSLYMQQESWSGGQFAGTRSGLLLFTLAVVVLAPIYEEILFRGFLLQGCLLWAPRQRVGCSLLTSCAFAAVHTQYAHLQTMLALILLSLLLSAARLVSSGLKLPIFLHMLNNLPGMTPWLWQALH